MLSFITYSLSKHELRPAEVFSSLALFNGLRMPLNLLPLVLGQVVDAWSSLKRIQEFLEAEDAEEDIEFRPDGDFALEMRDASYTWERTPTQDPEKTIGGATGGGGGGKDVSATPGTQPAATSSKSKPTSRTTGPVGPNDDTTASDAGSTLVNEEREPFKLQNINFEIKRNELVAIIGTVGSGKSSLLAALAGDMRKTGGSAVLGASRAFCPQYSWIQNATVRQNILFGKEMDKDWYQQVIQA
jgi:ABC-type multidrug transport system fused ATPase/permease subunit